jgi:hypothetical protein
MRKQFIEIVLIATTLISYSTLSSTTIYAQDIQVTT